MPGGTPALNQPILIPFNMAGQLGGQQGLVLTLPTANLTNIQGLVAAAAAGGIMTLPLQNLQGKLCLVFFWQSLLFVCFTFSLLNRAISLFSDCCSWYWKLMLGLVLNTWGILKGYLHFYKTRVEVGLLRSLGQYCKVLEWFIRLFCHQWSMFSTQSSLWNFKWQHENKYSV